MPKKIFTAIFLTATLLFAANVSYADADDDQIFIDESSVWYQPEKNVFGASVTIDADKYFPITYRIFPRADYGWDIHQMINNDGNWVHIGIKGAGIHDYSFQNKMQAKLFVTVSGAAARLLGRDSVF